MRCHLYPLLCCSFQVSICFKVVSDSGDSVDSSLRYRALGIVDVWEEQSVGMVLSLHIILYIEMSSRISLEAKLMLQIRTLGIEDFSCLNKEPLQDFSRVVVI